MTGGVIQGLFLGGQPKLAAVQPRTVPPPIQARMMARPPGPPATAFAMRAPGPPPPAFPGRPPTAPAFTGRQETVQRHGVGGAFAVDAAPLGLVSSGGRPLPEAVRGKMEAALGADFSAVRVHVGPQAERIGAIAFTVGSDIYFAPGRYQPDSIQGQQLLGHELTHVVQQRAGRVRNPLGSGLAVVQDHALEAEADRLGQRAALHRVAAQAKLAPSTAQPSAPVRISPPVGAGSGSYRLSAGAGGREIGSVMVHARDRGAVEVTDLGVSEAQRGNGVGRMLVAAAARTGLQSGRSKVTLAAQDRGSGHLTSWYREMGFTQTGVNQRGYPQLEAPISRVLSGLTSRAPTQPKFPFIQRMERRETRSSRRNAAVPSNSNGTPITVSSLPVLHRGDSLSRGLQVSQARAHAEDDIVSGKRVMSQLPDDVQAKIHAFSKDLDRNHSYGVRGGRVGDYIVKVGLATKENKSGRSMETARARETSRATWRMTGLVTSSGFVEDRGTSYLNVHVAGILENEEENSHVLSSMLLSPEARARPGANETVKKSGLTNQSYDRGSEDAIYNVASIDRDESRVVVAVEFVGQVNRNNGTTSIITGDNSTTTSTTSADSSSAGGDKRPPGGGRTTRSGRKYYSPGSK